MKDQDKAAFKPEETENEDQFSNILATIGGLGMVKRFARFIILEPVEPGTLLHTLHCEWDRA